MANAFFGPEYEIFSGIIQGTSLTEIAEKLSLSIKTASARKSQILTKLNLASNVDLLRYGIDHKLLDTAQE